MTVDIAFPLAFIGQGVPVSLQTKRADARIVWRQRVREAGAAALPQGHFASDGRIGVTLLYVPKSEMQGDIDNIVKPVLDALCRHVYKDDRQVERVWVQKFEPARSHFFSSG